MKRDWWDKEFKVLMTFGDSITAGGWSSARERCWSNQLSRMINEYQRIPVQMVNMGIGANVISTKSAGYKYSSKPVASERVDRDILTYMANGYNMRPDLLVIAYGINDARGGTPVDLFCSEMKDIINRIRAEIQPLIVLLGPYYMNGFNMHGPEWGYANIDVLYKYNDAIKQLAEEADCLFVDLLGAYREADWLVHHDGCHANDLGHRLVANKIFEILASNCQGLSLETKYLEGHIIPWRDESVLQD